MARGSGSERRAVYANAPKSNPERYNRQSNTKYTAWNFIPKNLMEQFSRHINRYFLLIGLLQLISEITPVHPATTLGPLAIIFAVSACRELLDDIGRRRADRAANEREYIVMRNGGPSLVQSQYIAVGDVVCVREDQEFPCDLVVLSTSDKAGNCYIQTTNLDGETNLKLRRPLEATNSVCRSPDEVGCFKGVVECSPPDGELYRFNALLRMSPRAFAHAISADQLLLQATVLRNTQWVYGLAVYTGDETKFGMTKKIPPLKWTRTDRLVNRFSIFIFLFQLALVAVLGALGNEMRYSPPAPMPYLQFHDERDEPRWRMLIIPARFLLLNSTMIPISIKVTLDLCKLIYSKYIDRDLAMYDDSSDTPARANNTAISEDLGQVQYVLTDKTGTLTENVMELKRCSIAGNLFGMDDEAGGSGSIFQDRRMRTILNHAMDVAPQGVAGGQEQEEAAMLFDVLNFWRALALNNTVVPVTAAEEQEREELASSMLLGLASPSAVAEAGDAGEEGGRAAAGVVGVGGTASPSDHVRLQLLRKSTGAMGAVGVLQDPDALMLYRGSSPDEAALVDAAQAFGVKLRHRQGQALLLRVNGADERFEVLHELEFTSDRKCMSTLVREVSTGRMFLFSKGADEVMVPKLADSEQGAAERTIAHVDAFAAEGLRTLLVAYREVREQEYQAWLAELQRCNSSLEHREQLRSEAYQLMERDLVLLGATAVEDKLQRGVPETINKLRRAGIRVWMLTGDKYSTALQIARSCHLFSPGDGNVLFSLEPEEEEPSGMGPVADVGHLIDAQHQAMQRLLHHRRALSGGAATPAPGGEAAGELPTAALLGEQDEGQGGAGDVCVIVRGSTLLTALSHHRAALRRLLMAADSVICCRVTPNQKAELLTLVKESGFVTLAIGDGGNDVAMIQEADVGVGIRGLEGQQAARAADYVVRYFRHLQRLLLVHGRYSYQRTSLVAQYSFYKSFAFCFLQIMFAPASAVSGASLFNSLCVVGYNSILFIPIVFFAVDRDISIQRALSFPHLYAVTRHARSMNMRTFAGWFLLGLLHAAFIIGAMYITHSDADMEVAGTTAFGAYLWVQDVVMLLSLSRLAWVNVGLAFGLHLCAVGLGLFTSSFTAFQFVIDYYSTHMTLADPKFWLNNLLVLGASLASMMLIAFAKASNSKSALSFQQHSALRALFRALDQHRTGAVPAAAFVELALEMTGGVPNFTAQRLRQLHPSDSLEFSVSLNEWLSLGRTLADVPDAPFCAAARVVAARMAGAALELDAEGGSLPAARAGELDEETGSKPDDAAHAEEPLPASQPLRFGFLRGLFRRTRRKTTVASFPPSSSASLLHTSDREDERERKADSFELHSLSSNGSLRSNGAAAAK